MLNSIWASAQFSGSGNGTENDPYVITNATNLSQLSNFLGQEGVVFKLMVDLDLTTFIAENYPTEGWTPVGVESSPFKGKFLGNNHTISGFRINKSTIDNVGFFGYVDGATIQDLIIQGTDVVGKTNVGVIVGCALNSTITNCSAELTGSSMLTATNGAGAIIGFCENTAITNCSYTGDVNCPINAGGIVGSMLTTTLADCVTCGNIYGSQKAGGIVGNIGYGTSSFTNCKYFGDLTGTYCIGGVVGKLEPLSSVTFTNCHTKCMITNTGDYTGGIVGMSNGGCISGMESCSHFGDINGVNYVGGLIGATTVANSDAEYIYISNSFTTNSKSEPRSTMDFYTGTDEIAINNCTAIGNITGSAHVGGLSGWDEKVYGCSNWKSGGPSSVSVSLTVQATWVASLVISGVEEFKTVIPMPLSMAKATWVVS